MIPGTVVVKQEPPDALYVTQTSDGRMQGRPVPSNHIPSSTNGPTPSAMTGPPTHTHTGNVNGTQNVPGPNPNVSGAVSQKPYGNQENLQKNTVEKPPDDTNQIDSSSARGVFGWTTVDGVSLPYLFRDGKKYVAVKMVEMKLLSRYPSVYPEELKKRPPLMSHYVTVHESKLLNEINTVHCDYEYGQGPFTQSDLIVKLSDFEEFYNIVKKHFPNRGKQQQHQNESYRGTVMRRGGWLQINNTVVPYVLRGNERFVPLSVIRYAAGLLTEIPVQGCPPSEDESAFLNAGCKSAGLNFTFGKNTNFISLMTVYQLAEPKPSIKELAADNPFSQAQYQILPTDMSSAGAMVPHQPYGSAPQGLGQRPMHPSMYLQHQTAMAARMMMSSERMPYSMDTSPFWMNPHLGIYPRHPGAGQASMQEASIRPTLYPAGMGAAYPGAVDPGVPPNVNVNVNVNVIGAATASARSSAQHVSSKGTSSHPSPNSSLGSPGHSPATVPQLSPSQIKAALHSRQQLNHASLPPQQPSPSPHNATPMSPAAMQQLSPQMQAHFGAQFGQMPPPGVLPYYNDPRFRGQQGASIGNPRWQMMQTSAAAELRHMHAMMQAGQMPPPPPPITQQLQLTPRATTPAQQAIAEHVKARMGATPVQQGNGPRLNVSPQQVSPTVASSGPPNVAPCPITSPAPPQASPNETAQTQVVTPPTATNTQTPVTNTPVPPTGTAPRPPRIPAPVPIAPVQAPSPATATPPVTATSPATVVSSATTAPPATEPSPAHKSPAPQPLMGTLTRAGNGVQSTENIKPVEFEGKTISCLVKGAEREKYALVEAVARVYFPYCTLQEFEFAMENVLNVPTCTLDPKEEQTFIAFYRLPTNVLMCNKAVKLKDFKQFLPQLRYMFREKEAAMKTKSPSKADKSPNKSEGNRINPPKPVIVSDDEDQSENSNTKDGSLKTGSKREAEKDKEEPSPKQACRRLEDMVNKLRKNQGAVDGSDAEVVTSENDGTKSDCASSGHDAATVNINNNHTGKTNSVESSATPQPKKSSEVILID